MNTVKIDQKEIRYPSNFNEIDQKDFQKISNIIFSNLPYLQKKAKILKYYFGKKALRKVYPNHIQQLNKTLNWIESTKLTKDIIHFKIKQKEFIGAGNILQHLTLIEFHHTELFLHLYKQTKDVNYAYKIAAVLFRTKEKKQAEDLRTKFITTEIDRRAALFKKALSPTLLNSILFYYSSCTQKIFEDYKDVFESEEQKQQFKNHKAKNDNAPPNWSSLIFQLAQSDIVKAEKIAEMTLLTVLNFIRIEKAKK